MANDLTDDELLTRIEQEESVAYGLYDQELSEERAKAIQYYFGEPLGNEVEGRSQVVSRDVQEVIDAALPQVLKVFVSGDQVVRFDPKGPEDQAGAEQETDYINHVVMEKNEGFQIFYTWFKDALLSKNGYVKVWYEENEEYEDESYQGLTDAQLLMLTKDPEIEVLEHSQYPDQFASIEGQNPAQAMMMGAGVLPQPMLHDVKIRCVSTRGCVRIANVAPENMMVSVDTQTVGLQKSRFVQHREMKTKADIIAMGFEVPEECGYATNDIYDQESIARDKYNEEMGELTYTEFEYLVRDTYMLVDGKRMHYVHVNQSLVHSEEMDYVPIACITPQLMPHRHVGLSYADMTMDIQEIKSTLVRGQLDNTYLSNNGRYAINENVNLDDMLTSRPGGVVRVKGNQGPGASIFPLQHVPFPATSFTMVEYFDTAREKRTGVTAYNQGLDVDSLNKTKGGMAMVMNASQQRLELVARLFAETGVKELFLLVHREIRTHYTKPDIVRLRNKWVNVDPRNWKTRKDLSIAVGLGTGNKDQQMMHLSTILQAQKEAIQLGIATPKNIYNALVKLTQNAGFKNPEEFWTDPTTVPPKPPQEDPLVAIERVKTEGQLKLQQDKNHATIAQTHQKNASDAERETQKTVLNAELEKYKAELRAQTDLIIEQMKQQMAIDPYQSRFDAMAQQMINQTNEALQGMIAQMMGASQVSPVVGIRRINDEFGNLIGAVQVHEDGTESPIEIQ